MSIIKGGAAGFKSVSFYSENFRSKAIRSADGTIIVNISKRRVASRFEGAISRIPFIRGLYLFVKPAIVMWEIYLFVFLPLLIVLLLLSHDVERVSNSSLSSLLSNIAYSIQNHFLLVMAIILVIFSVITKFSNIGKYHGAEHMTDTSFSSLFSLEISDIVKQSRIHNDCGTNFVVFLFVIYFILSFFILDLIALIILSICLSYEVFLIQSKIFAPFYWLGGLFQYYLFTSKPSKKHLEVAVASYEALLKEERDL